MGVKKKEILKKEDRELEHRRKFRTIDLAYMGLFVALMAICSWISIPTAVPFTLQTFAVFITVSTLGLYRGTVSVIVYILLGLLGVPVFSGFKGGPGVLLGTTGGYIIGFIFTAMITGGIIRCFGKKVWVMVVAMLLGLVACYTFGTVWFLYVYTKDVGTVGLMAVLGWCVFPFVIPDCLKIALAIVVQKSVGRHIK